MKLFFAGAPKSSGFVEISPPGISIGRELDNDIILESESASRYHCKLIWRDGEWFLKDLNSTNGTKLNGLKITDEVKLKEGDEIAIGYQKLIFAEDLKNKQSDKVSSLSELENKSTQKPPLEEKSENKNPDTKPQSYFGSFFSSDEQKKSDSEAENAPKSPFFSKEKSEDDGTQKDERKHASPIFYAIVILTALVLVGGFLLVEKIMNESKNKQEAQKKTAADYGTPLTVIYEKQISSPDNIFRYELRIRNNVITVTRDDLKHSIRFRRQQQLEPELLENLKHELKETDFMNVSQPQAGISPDNTDENKVLTIAYENSLNTVRIRNAFEPAGFKAAVEAIENFSNHVLNIPTISKTPEEMLQEAESSFEKAEMLYANRAARAENLREALKRYNIVVELLEFFEPKPAMYDQAYRKSQEVKQLIEEEVRVNLVNAQQAYKLRKFDEAINSYRKVMELLEPADKRYETAKSNIVKLEQIIIATKKGKK